MNVQVLEASGVSEALFMVNRWPDEINVLITDINLGKESGWECATEVARLKPSCQIVFMSASIEANGWERHWKRPDGSYFIQKPFLLSELSTLLRKIFKEQGVDSVDEPSAQITEKSSEERR
jgi:DNA-binding NtrC family response regulator